MGSRVDKNERDPQRNHQKIIQYLEEIKDRQSWTSNSIGRITPRQPIDTEQGFKHELWIQP